MTFNHGGTCIGFVLEDCIEDDDTNVVIVVQNSRNPLCCKLICHLTIDAMDVTRQIDDRVTASQEGEMVQCKLTEGQFYKYVMRNVQSSVASGTENDNVTPNLAAGCLHGDFGVLRSQIMKIQTPCTIHERLGHKPIDVPNAKTPK